MAKKKDEIIAFGMTKAVIEERIEQLSGHVDKNHASNIKIFLDVIDKGHKALTKQKDYGKIKIKV